MPTDTFLKLSEEKKEKIIEAGKQEFSQSSLSEASIKNIVQNAGIARGSFYQYFENKEDLLKYILEINRESIDKKINKTLELSKGDIFDFYIRMYDDMTEKCFNDKNHEIYRKIFENIKASEGNIYGRMEENKKKRIKELKNAFNTKNLRVESEADLDRIIEILNSVTIGSIMKILKIKSKNDARKRFIRKIELLKKGIEK